MKKDLSILVIEDNPGDLVLVEDYLIEKLKTVKIIKHKDYKSTVKFLECEKSICDIILLDLNLPDMKGIELVENMMIQSPQIPIIILTGYTDLPLAKKSLELGVYDFLIKDEINPTLLHKSIDFAISRSNYVRQIEQQNEKLKSIAWTQSHVVRAPLARILGIVDMIENLDNDANELAFWLEQLKVSSNEMDEIVRDIVKKTQTIKFKKQ
ncbi:response regulator [Aquimarina brevivitae]|uniref:histidine kinase n=1 Tax=Aquimarina brevivitae TaxID=323412 RepID=A0A4V2F5T6_9FLAO|nr:response regulator [Aquimarina brevivitae]RZS93949.1 response regulator receiver domain-containing protein [Aquimarina brevivitae]